MLVQQWGTITLMRTVKKTRNIKLGEKMLVQQMRDETLMRTVKKTHNIKLSGKC